ncbi:MAG: hypothetical protein LBK05_07090 [Treponema sp.]|jgi:hypothetical protein|nr:hypothetical protein [Treponema sp.]
MPANITFNPAAFKHGVTEADIRRAIDIYIYEDPLEDYENKYLLLGYDTKGMLLEIMVTIQSTLANKCQVGVARKK